jgi:hypothetical protein
LLAFIIIASLLVMQVYVKRGLQGRYKSLVDTTGELTGLRQYEPYYVDSNMTSAQNQSTTYTYKDRVLARDIDSTVESSGEVITGVDLSADDEWEE